MKMCVCVCLYIYIYIYREREREREREGGREGGFGDFRAYLQIVSMNKKKSVGMSIYVCEC